MPNVKQMFTSIFTPDPEKGAQENFDEIVECISKLIPGNDYKITLELPGVERDVDGVNDFLNRINTESDVLDKLDLASPVSVDRNGNPLFGLKNENSNT